jgi:hypothetical protein
MTAAQLFTDGGKWHDVYKGAYIFLNLLTLFLWAFGETTTCLTFLSVSGLNLQTFCPECETNVVVRTLA